ncbi:MAG: extracellular solute-binding protein [Erysipelotrichaceae bacterium]|nr:extracellular solute-binding protein [Erysipelotrichaceae bacterium]
MNKNLRKPALVIIVLLLLLPLSGCPGQRQMNDFVMPEQFDTSRNYEIVFWAKNDTNKYQTAIYNRAVSDFEKLYPNVKVSIRLYTDYSRIYNDVITNMATGTTPNVCITYPDHVATYLTGNNTVVPLDELYVDGKYGLAGSEVRFDSPSFDQMVSKFVEEGKLGEHYYCIPFMRSTEALYINKTYVNKLGYEIPEVLSWDYVFEIARKAAEKDGEGNYLLNGQKVMIPFIYKSTDNMMIQMLRQLNAPYSSADGEVLIFSEETKGILEMVRENVEAEAFSTFKISSYPANFLNAGQCIFAIDSTAGATWMGPHAPLGHQDIAEENLVDFEMVVRMIPQFDAANPVMISQGPSICIFNKADPQEVLASWLFAQYLLTNDIQIGYSQTEGYSPVTLKAQQDPEYLQYLALGGSDDEEHYFGKIDAVKLLIANTENTFVTPVFNGSASLREASGALIEETAKAVNRRQTVDEAFYQKLYGNVTSLYHLDQISAGSAGRADLGPLPRTAVMRLGGLAAVWLFLAVYYLNDLRKNKSEKQN